MSKQYFVTCVETVECETCEGTGWVMHPAWARYWKENGDKADMMSAEDDLEWFRATYSEGLFNYRSYGDLPSEEVTCPDCGGEQRRTYQVDLFTALRDLGVLNGLMTAQDRLTLEAAALVGVVGGGS